MGKSEKDERTRIRIKIRITSAAHTNIYVVMKKVKKSA